MDRIKKRGWEKGAFIKREDISIKSNKHLHTF